MNEIKELFKYKENEAANWNKPTKNYTKNVQDCILGKRETCLHIFDF